MKGVFVDIWGILNNIFKFYGGYSTLQTQALHWEAYVKQEKRGGKIKDGLARSRNVELWLLRLLDEERTKSKDLRAVWLASVPDENRAVTKDLRVMWLSSLLDENAVSDELVDWDLRRMKKDLIELVLLGLWQWAQVFPPTAHWLI